MLDIILSILASKDILTEKEAKYLSKELRLVIQPSRFDDANVLIEQLLKDYEATL